jgi:hypothetical protein
VTNSGPATVENVTVSDPTPTGLTFVSNSGACTTVFPCALGALAAGQQRVITTTLTVPQGYAGPDPIRNVATVTSTTADPNTANNTAEAKTTPQKTVNDPNNNGKGDKKDNDEQSKPTEEQQLNQQHTNAGNHEQYATGGGVSHVEKTPDGLTLLVTLKQAGGASLVVAFACPGGTCPDIIVDDQIEVDGVQGDDLPEQKGWFMAESFDYVSKAPRGR